MVLDVLAEAFFVLMRLKIFLMWSLSMILILIQGTLLIH